MSEQEEPDMTNKLGEIRRANVRAFIDKKKMSMREFSKISAINLGTSQQSFGNGKNPTSASEKTMAKVYKSFEELPKGCLDKVDFKPTDTPVIPSILKNKPVVIPKEIFIQVGRLRTPVSEEMAKRILIMIALEDEEE